MFLYLVLIGPLYYYLIIWFYFDFFFFLLSFCCCDISFFLPLCCYQMLVAQSVPGMSVGPCTHPQSALIPVLTSPLLGTHPWNHPPIGLHFRRCLKASKHDSSPFPALFWLHFFIWVCFMGADYKWIPLSLTLSDISFFVSTCSREIEPVQTQLLCTPPSSTFLDL